MEAFEEAAEDAQRQEFGILEEHIEIKEAEYDDVIVYSLNWRQEWFE